MFYIILLILIAFTYIFLMPKDIRRSMDIFFFAGVGVLVIAFAVAQAFSHQTLLLEILVIIAMLGVMVKAWVEIGNLDKRHRRSGANRKR
ncbi:DUF3165 family protein [Lactococcus allomyrinae]|uniref:DUF3165 family protein n=1 Tax=Lactococcus allomyrinae TaxID=2419773 RepID=A0A387BFK1_9LACT|nr:DUF3165 family protein [Lactococcus allomyrinae]AYG01044.1 DUF3165 family protein [Lactococcus allomyrinae]